MMTPGDLADAGDRFHPMMRPWRCHNGLAVVRLQADVVGADLVPRMRAGALALARWSAGKPPLARGWIVQDVGFLCIMREPDVDVIERP